MEPEIIEAIDLSNGLTLEILDATRKVAADRWLIKLVARIRIDIVDKWFDPRKERPVPLDQLQFKLGDAIEHTYQVERNFVDISEKKTVHQQLLASIKAKQSYYSHPDFAARCILKSYAAQRNKPNNILD